MKLNKINKFMAAVLLTGAPMLWSACTDTWNEHYNVVPGGMADQASLLENIAADPALSNFYKVVNNIGGAELLNSPQQFTIWAPRNLSDAQVDSIIEVYKSDAAAGMKWEDNKAVTQFLQNHMALYARPVSSYTADTVVMRNLKYMFMEGNSNTSGTLAGNAFNDMVICNNGILYKTDDVLQFFPNVREYTELNPNMSKLTEFFKSWDEYELDLEASTPGGVEDGKTVYLDSVTTLYNRFLNSYGYIHREDSVYTFLAPTDEVWNKEYEKYSQYFNYTHENSLAAIRDSLHDIHTALCILEGRFFNTSKNWRYNFHPEDSLCSTWYWENQKNNPRVGVYYKPQEGILNGLQKSTCSNGVVYIDNKGVIDPRTTFFTRDEFDCDLNYELPKDKNSDPTMNAQRVTYEMMNAPRYEYVYDEEGNIVEEKLISDGGIKKYSGVEISAKTASSQAEVEYKITSTLSNVYYNIYLVTLPAIADRTNTRPTWFEVQHREQNDKGVFGTKTNFVNPHAITADSDVENADVILAQSNNNRCYVASGESIDTILVASAFKLDYTGYSIDGGVLRLTVKSFGPSTPAYREKIYTRTLRLNEIILVPFETKEEAEAAADDLNAFNNAVLAGLKEN